MYFGIAHVQNSEDGGNAIFNNNDAPQGHNMCNSPFPFYKFTHCYTTAMTMNRLLRTATLFMHAHTYVHIWRKKCHSERELPNRGRAHNRSVVTGPIGSHSWLWLINKQYYFIRCERRNFKSSAATSFLCIKSSDRCLPSFVKHFAICTPGCMSNFS